MPRGVYVRKNPRKPKFCLDCGISIDWRSKYCKRCSSKGDRNASWKGGRNKKKYQASYYQQHKDKIKGQVAAWRANKRLKIREVLSKIKEKPCMDCNQSYPPYVMDFDHVRGEKKFSISQAVDLNVSLEAARNEIAKCDLVCANCHRERTHGNRKSTKL